MERIVNGEKDGMSYWLEQINVPRAIKGLIILDRLGLDVEMQKRSINLGGEDISVVAIPMLDIGFADENTVHDAVLSAMGYMESDLPILP